MYTFIECQFLICLYWLLLLNVLTKFCRHVLLLGIASKIEPPTHSHEILISTLLITGEDLSLSLSQAQDYEGPFSFILLFYCLSYRCQSFGLGFNLKGPKFKVIRFPRVVCHVTLSHITLLLIKTKLNHVNYNKSNK